MNEGLVSRLFAFAVAASNRGCRDIIGQDDLFLGVGIDWLDARVVSLSVGVSEYVPLPHAIPLPPSKFSPSAR